MNEAAADSPRVLSLRAAARKTHPGEQKRLLPLREKPRLTPRTAPSTLPGPGQEPGAFKRVLEAGRRSGIDR